MKLTETSRFRVIRELQYINFYYGGVNCNYHTSYSCEDYGCNEEHICRCGVIEETNISDVNVDQVIDTLFKDLKITDPIVQFSIDRWCRRNMKKEDFEVRTCGGYYGEEIDGIYFINPKLEEFLHQTRKDLLNQLLIDEYGYLLSHLKDCEYQVEIVGVDDIITPQKDQAKKADSGLYDNKIKDLVNKIPIALCEKKGSKYYVIDGYHRVAALRKTKLTIAEVITAIPKNND